jgi:hypothetical protein
MGVVELAHGFFFRALQLLEGGPLLQEVAGERSEEILPGQLQSLGEVTLQGIAQHVGEEGAQIDGGAALFEETGERAGLGVVGLPRGELLAMMQE